MADENKKTILGLLASGLVMSKNKYPGRDGKPDRFSIDLAIPGVREMLSIQVKPEVWGTVQDMQEWKSLITFRLYKGVVYFEAASI
ncbi:MAG: hypothetical protein JZU65_23920 [Chlorobium sp.]|nr:hypothetical protein [Chlorobium sp.]